MPGTHPGPSPGVFGGRQVSARLAAGASVARTPPLVKSASTGVGESPRRLAAREVASTVGKLGPVSAGEPSRRRGTSLAPQDRPSTPSAGSRLVRATTSSLLEQTQASGAWMPPKGFKWQNAYNMIQFRSRRGDSYAAAALGEIDRAVMDAYRNGTVFRFSGKYQPTSEMMLADLEQMRMVTWPARVRHRVEAIGRSIDDIYRLTHVRNMELRLRCNEFPSVPLRQGVPVPRALTGSLPSSGQLEPAARLEAAHHHLAQAVASNPSRQAAETQRSVVSALRGSRVAASMRQEIVGRLSNRSPLSDEQVRGVLVAVTQAAASGTLGASTSQPEAWARGLLERVLASFQKRIDDLTELETIQESSDVKRLDELLERLDGPGLL